MAVIKLSKKDIHKNDGNNKIKLDRSQISIDSGMVSDLEFRNKDSLKALEQYRKKVNSGGYLSADDLNAYRKALDSYVETSKSLRNISKAFGQGGGENDRAWSDTIASLKRNYDNVSKYYSQFASEKEYMDYQIGWLVPDAETNEETVVARKNRYESNSSRIEEIKKELPWYGDTFLPSAIENIFLSDEHDALKAEMEMLESENLKYKRTQGVLDQYYTPVTEEFQQNAGYRDYSNASKEELWAYDMSAIEGSVALNGGGYFDEAGNIYDAKGNLVQSGTAPEVTDKLGMFLSTSEEEITEAYNRLVATNGNYTDTWANLIREGDMDGWKQLSEHEINIYYDLYKREGQEAAYKFLSDMTTELNRRETQRTQDYINEAPVLEQIFLNVASVPMSVLGGATAFAEDAVNTIQGEDINPYSRAHAFQNAAGDIRSKTATDINDLTGNAALPMVGTTFGDVYQSIMSFADSALASAIPGGYVLLGMNAASTEMKGLYERGGSTEQIFAGGILAGAAEMFFEKYSMGELKKIKNMDTKAVKNFADGFVRAVVMGGVEASEEMATEIANTISDALVMGSQTDWVDVETFAKNVVNAGIGGFISGGLGGAIAAKMNNAQHNKQAAKHGRSIIDKGGVDALQQLALEMSGSNKAIGKLSNKVSAEATAKNVGKLSDLIGETTTAQNLADITKALEEKGLSKRDAKRVAEYLNKASQGEYFTEQEAAEVEGNENISDVWRDIIGDPKSPVNDRAKKLIAARLGIATQTEPSSQNGENVSAENTVPTEKEMPSQVDYEAAVEGKTIRKSTGEAVSIKEVASVGNGKMTLRLEDGSEVDSKEIAYSNAGEAYVYETVANLGVDAVEATRLINAFRNSGAEGKAFADGMKLAFEYGYGNFSQQELTQKDFAGNIPRMYINTAYEIGQKMRQQESEQNSTTQEPSEKRTAKKCEVYYTTNNGKVLSMSQAEKNGKLALKDKQSVAVKTAKFLQKLGLGGNYYFFESYVDERGNRVFKDRFGNIQSAPNGLYYSDGDIYIDINAGTDSHSITLRTLSHELTHMIQQWSAAKYKVIADFLAEQYDKEGRNAYEAAKAKQAQLSALRGKFVPFQEAYHEFVADSMSTLFDDGNMYDILTDLKKKDKTLVDYIKKFFDGLAAKVRKLYANAQAETDEGQFVQGLSKDTIYRLQQMFAEALVEASENYATSEQKNTDTQIGVQYSFGEQSAQSDITAKYKKIVDNVISGTHTDKSAVLLGYTPETYQKMGMPSLPFVIGVGHIYSIAKTEAEAILENRYSKKMNYHGLGDAAVKNIYEATKDPIMVIASKDVNPRSSPLRSTHSIVAIVDVGHNGKHLLLPVEITAKRTVDGEEMDVNVLSSAYNKKVSELVREAVALENIGEVGVYYIKKGATLPADSGVQFPIHLNKKIASGGIIHKFSEKVNMNISDATQSRQFKRWFGDWQNHPENASKVVNKDGTPKVVYHGSTEQFTTFSYGHIGSATGVGILGDGFYFTDKKRLAKNYGGNVYPVYLQMKNPYVATESDAYKLRTTDIQAQGYDGVILRAPQGDVYMVFENTQIKSATDNIGTFDGSNPDIRYQDRTATPSNRELLAQALEGVATDVEDFYAVKEYRRIVPLLDAEEAKLSRLNAQIREMSFGKGKRDNDKLFALRLEAKQTQNRIDIYDKQLLKLEATTPLQRVLEREKAKAYKRAEQKGKEAVQKEKERAQAKYDELAAKNTASRKKAVEGRHKTEMRHKIQKVVKKLNDLLLNETKDHHIPSGLKKPVAEALDAIDVAMSNPADQIAAIDDQIAKATTPEQAAELGAKKAKLEERAERFADKVNALKAAYDAIKQAPDMAASNSYDEVISSKIQEVSELIGETPLYDMNLSQLEAVYDMYRMIAKAVSNGNKAFKMARAESISQLGAAVGNEVTAAGGSHQYSVKALDGIKKFDWNNMKPVYAFERIGSQTFTELFNNVRAGEDVWAVDVTEARDFYLDQSKKYGYDQWDMDKRYTFESTTGKSFHLTLEQIMSLYAYSKRDQADDHLRMGGFVFDSAIEVVEKKHGIPVKYTVNTATAYNLSPEILADIVGTLTEEQTEFVDVMQDYLSTVMGAKGNEVSMALYDVKLFKEKHYFPLKSAKQYMYEQNEVAGEIRLKNSGFSKKTQPHASNPVILSNFMDVWAKHIDDMSMYHAFVLPLEDFNRVYNYKSSTEENTDTESVKGRIQNAYGAQANEYISQLIKDLNGGARSDPRETFSKALMSRFKKAAVMGSLSVVVQQPTAMIRAMALVDAKYFGIAPITRGLVRTINAKKHKALWDEIKRYAPVAVIKEMGHFDTDTGRSTVDYIKGNKTFMDKVDDVLAFAPAKADEMAWISIWEAIKRETVSVHKDLRPGSDEFLKVVGERFTEVVTKTQVYDSVLSRSGNMRSKTAFMNMWTAFMAEPTTSINMLQDALSKGKTNKRYAARTVGAVYGSVILNAALVSVVYAMRDDDEDETFAEKYLSRLTTEILDGINPVTYIPFLKDVWSVMQGFDIERADMSLISDLTDTLQQAIKVIATDTSDMDSEKLGEHQKKVSDALWSLADNIASISGVPLKNVRRDFVGIRNLFETIMKDAAGRKTSAGSLLDKLFDAIKDATPVWGWLPGESRGDKLYDAIVNGDTDYVERLKNAYKSESAYTSAIRKALRENDPRIKEAAQAVLNGNTAERVRIVKEIMAEGHFETKDIQAAINAEVDKLRKKAE